MNWGINVKIIAFVPIGWYITENNFYKNKIKSMRYERLKSKKQKQKRNPLHAD